MKIIFILLCVLVLVSCSSDGVNSRLYTKERVKRIVHKQKIELKEKSISNDVSDPFVYSKSNKYYVIIASCSQKKESLNLAMKYNKLGYDVKIIRTPNRYRVSIYSSLDKQESVISKDLFINSLKKYDLWVFKY